MSTVRQVGTALDSPSMAIPSDTGFVPPRQSCSTVMEVQEVDLGQSYAGFGQPTFTRIAPPSCPETFISAAADLSASPHLLQHRTPSMQAFNSGPAPQPIARISNPTSSPFLGHQTTTDESGLQQWALDPPWSSAAALGSSQYEQCQVEQAMVSHQPYFVPGQQFVGDDFEPQRQAPLHAHPQEVIDLPYNNANPYPDLPRPPHYAPQAWQAPNDDDYGGGVDYGCDGKLNTSYAHLIYMCLLEAPNHSRKLKEIYDWIKIRTNKADDLTTNGWQNSVRHNLSMNKVCTRTQ